MMVLQVVVALGFGCGSAGVDRGIGRICSGKINVIGCCSYWGGTADIESTVVSVVVVGVVMLIGTTHR